VISDRFVDASYAYQGAGRGIEVARIEALQRWTLGGMQADLTLLLDVSPEVGLARAEKVRAKDRFEQESIGFFVRVRNAYLARAKAFPERYRVVDAGVAPDVVGERLRTSVCSFFGWI
jgi:dTMP kinase